VFALLVLCALLGSLALNCYSARGVVLADLPNDSLVREELAAPQADDISIRTVAVGAVREPLTGVWTVGYSFELTGPQLTGGKTMRVSAPIWPRGTVFRLDDGSAR